MQFPIAGACTCVSVSAGCWWWAGDTGQGNCLKVYNVTSFVAENHVT